MLISSHTRVEMDSLTHFDGQGQAHMVDVSGKSSTHRMAVAAGQIGMKPETLQIISAGTAKKGDVLGIARIAGIQAAKKTLRQLETEESPEIANSTT